MAERFKGTTSSGFDFEIDPENMDNMELLEELAKFSESNPLPLPKICEYLLGADQKAAFYEHLRKVDGRRVNATGTKGGGNNTPGVMDSLRRNQPSLFINFFLLGN